MLGQPVDGGKRGTLRLLLGRVGGLRAQQGSEGRHPSDYQQRKAREVWSVLGRAHQSMLRAAGPVLSWPTERFRLFHPFTGARGT
jgi:hypothetical protein